VKRKSQNHKKSTEEKQKQKTNNKQQRTLQVHHNQPIGVGWFLFRKKGEVRGKCKPKIRFRPKINLATRKPRLWRNGKRWNTHITKRSQRQPRLRKPKSSAGGRVEKVKLKKTLNG